METRNLTCICCPMGCSIRVEDIGGRGLRITGSTCRRGEEYARKEVTSPTRIVTSTVRVEGGILPVVSVKTEKDIPKESIFDCIKALKGVCVKAPVEIGDIIVADATGTGVNLVATKPVPQK